MAENKRDLSEELFVAIETIANKSLEGLKYDKTTLCTVTNATNADNGEYTVSDGSIEFIAYSNGDQKYKSGENVYVSVPQGDYNQQKFIIGKYKSDDDKPYSYISPTESYINIVNLDNEMSQINSATHLIQNAGSILANDPKEKRVLIFKKNNINDLNGYKRLGISAYFRTDLSQFNTISGNYGLLLKLICKEKRKTDYVRDLQADQDEDADNIKDYIYEADNDTDDSNNNILQTIETELISSEYALFLDTDDMFGNPYGFIANSLQEKVFDISDFVGITSLELYLYQKNNFKDISGQAIPYNYDGINGKEKLLKNIYVNNISISFGYDINDFIEKPVLLYTLDGNTYSEQKSSNKELHMKWITQIDDEYRVIDSISDLEERLAGMTYDIVWYKWVMEEDINDYLAGVFWQRIFQQNDLFNYIFTPDTSKQYARFKVGIIIYEDSTKENIQTYLESDVLEFQNENNVLDQTVVSLIQGLELTIFDGSNNTSSNSNGTYAIYLANGNLMNENDANISRRIEASYSSLITGFQGLDGTETVTWRVPAHNTMIVLNNTDIINQCQGENGLNVNIKEENGFYIIENAGVSNESDSIEIIGGHIKRKAVLPYKIAKCYSQLLTNNTIECMLHKNGIDYGPHRIQLSFAVSGTNGTDYTLVLEMADPDKNALIAYNGNDNIYRWQNNYPVIVEDGYTGTEEQFIYLSNLKVRAQLRDYKGDLIDLKYGIQSGWLFNLETNSTDVAKITVAKNGTLNADGFYYFTIYNRLIYKKKDEAPPSDYSLPGNSAIDYYPKTIIFKATVKHENQILEAYLPIPVARNKTRAAHTFEGPTKIIYSGSGKNPTYARIPYRLWDGDNEILQDGTTPIDWKLGIYSPNVGYGKTSVDFSNNVNNGNNYSFRQKNLISDTGDGYPYTTEEHNLVCPDLYFNNLYNNKVLSMCVYAGNNKILWIQPILVLLNRFGSSMLNKWDGSLTIDSENNQILTSVVAAGKKEEDNSYSGVVLGEIGKVDSDVSEKTGLLGYNHGEQTFLLSADDGHLELGKSGAGQIIMQGDSGEIKSGNYQKNKSGMKIELKEGAVDAYNFKLSSRNVSIDSSGENSYFKIYGTNTRNALINATSNQTLLQSSDAQVQLSLSGNNETSFFQLNKNIDYWSNKTNEIKSYTFPAVYISNTNPYFAIRKFDDYNRDTIDVDGITYPIGASYRPLLYIGDTAQYLRSFNYATASSGMKIDLNDGKIDAYNFKLTSNRVVIDSSGGDSYFKINGSTTALMDVQEDITLLQSGDTKTKIKLYKTGSFDTKSPSGFFSDTYRKKKVSEDSSPVRQWVSDGIRLSNVSPFLEIKTLRNTANATTFKHTDNVTYWSDLEATTLISIGTSDWYLQSANYDPDNYTGMKLDLNSGRIIGYNSKLEFRKHANFYYLGKRVKVNGTTNTYETVFYEPMVEAESTSRICTIDLSNTTDTSIKINGNDYSDGQSCQVYCALSVLDKLPTEGGDGSFRIRPDNRYTEWSPWVKKKEENNILTLNSTSSKFPISINNGNFKVSWAGTLLANAGRIGGWTIGKEYLSSNAGTVGMSKWLGNDKPVFWSGYDAYDNADWAYKVGFGVAGDGTLYANKAHIGSWTIDFNSTTYPKALIGGPFKKVTKINDGGEPVKTEIEQDKRVILDPESGMIRANQFVGYLNGVAYSAKYVENVPSHTHDVTVPEHTHDITLYYTKKSNVQVVTDVIGRAPVYGYLTYISDISISSGTKLTDFKTESSSSDSGSTGSSGDNCFLMGTKILMADYSYKNIENIQIGDIILAYDEDKKIFIPDIVIKNQLHTGVKQLRKIIFNNDNNNNDSIILTPGHPILTLDGWKSQNIDISLKIHNVKAKYLTVKDQIIDYMLNNNQILSIIEINNNQLPVYNITTKYTHTYIANNIITHNKMVVYPVEQ